MHEDLDHADRLDDHGGLPLRPMPTQDGRASDAAAADCARPLDWDDRTRMQYVSSRDRQIVEGSGRRGYKSEIRLYSSTTGPRWYAYVTGNGETLKLGHFPDLAFAERAIAAVIAAIPQTPDEVIEEYIAAVCEAVPECERRAWFKAGRDPISESAQRLRVSLTLAQVGRIFGLSKERIRQIESWGLSKLRRNHPELALYLERADVATHWEAIEVME